MDLNTRCDFPVRADAARLAAISEGQASRFREAFAAAGYLPSSADVIPDVIELRARGGRNIPRLLCLTAAEKPLDVLARLFLLGVPVSTTAARSAMTAVPLEEWCEAGLVHIDGEHVRGLVAISLFNGLLLASDKPELLDRGATEDYVCGMTNSTAALVDFMVQRPCRSVLDVGTGCGVLVFLAARRGGNVLGTDLNPRAVQFAAFNARLNGISNVEFSTGSTFEPARGRKFDLIIANPPCVLGPAARYSFRDSGQELDNLCRQIVAEAPDYLEDGGIFQCTAEWPNIGGAEWRKRLSEWLDDLHCDALGLHLRTKDAQSHAEETVCDTDVLDSGQQVHLYAVYADYFESRDVTSISEGLVALRHRSGTARNRVQLENLANRQPGSFGDAVWQYFATSDELERLGNGLLDVKLQLAPSVSMASVRTWKGKGWSESSYAMRQGEGFKLEAGLDLRIASLVRQCDGTKTLRELVSGMADDAHVPLDAVASGSLNLIRRMLQQGFLTFEEGEEGVRS